LPNKDSCVGAGIDFIYLECKLGGTKHSGKQHKSKTIKQGAGESEKKRDVSI